MDTLDITHPELCKQIHPTKNNGKSGKDFKKGMNIKIWWLCPKTNCEAGCLHEFQAYIYSRTGKRANGCPFCARKQFCKHNSLAGIRPDLLKEWDYVENKGLDPTKIGPNSGKPVSWICPKTCPHGCPHKYETRISHRTRRPNPTNCPYCSKPRKRCCEHTSLAAEFPNLTPQWHPTKNNIIKFPTLVEQLYPDWKEDDLKDIQLLPTQVTSSSHWQITWLCKDPICGCEHVWESTPLNRTRDAASGCPFCSKPAKRCCIHNSLLMKEPKISSEWHPDNDGKPEDFLPQSHEPKKWHCPETNCAFGCPHDYESPISHRTNGNGCPLCSGRSVCPHNSVEAKSPDLMLDWDYVENAKLGLMPSKLSNYSGQNAWWCCRTCQEKWKTNIGNRTGVNRTGCPRCSQSKGEKAIKDYLDQHDDIKYTPQKMFPELGKMKFDYFFQHPKLRHPIISEYDGIGHFLQYFYIYGEKIEIHHLEAYERDRKKDLFCKEKLIHIIRIAFPQLLTVDQVMNEFIQNCIKHEEKDLQTCVHTTTSPELFQELHKLVQEPMKKLPKRKVEEIQPKKKYPATWRKRLKLDEDRFESNQDVPIQDESIQDVSIQNESIQNDSSIRLPDSPDPPCPPTTM